MSSLKNKFQALLALQKEILRRKTRFNPVYYGLPDLLFPINYFPGKINSAGNIDRKKLDYEETLDQYKQRQKDSIRDLIQNRLFVYKDNKVSRLILINQQIDMISDLIYGYTECAIGWKCRGGGGSLAASVVIFLAMIYLQKSFIDLAGSGEQAKNVYKYVCSFWQCFPELKNAILTDEPLQSETRLKSGVALKCITASPKAARGKHIPGLVIDEGCQEDKRLDDVFKAAMNVTMSENDRMILIMSTFHLPVGFYQLFWDESERRGFKKYKWDVYDTMEKCDAGLDMATSEDPLALDFCKNKCPLTESYQDYDDQGNFLGIKYEGCCGKARCSSGWTKREDVVKAKQVNDRDVFRVEFECLRPKTKGPIFGIDNIEKSVVEDKDINFSLDSIGVIGIDWGYQTEGAMVFLKDCHDYVAVVDSVFLTKKKISEWIEIIDRWKRWCSSIVIFADSSHPFSNRELEEYGHQVGTVNFGVAREYAEYNLGKYFNFNKIRISNRLEKLIYQLKVYHKDAKGRIVKKDDHGPDALECGMLHWDFMKKYGEEIIEKAKSSFDIGKKEDNKKGFEVIEI